MSITVTWYGHAVTALHTDKVKLLIDPFITGNDLCPLKLEQAEADVIAVTHGHSDHLGDTVALARRTGALVVSNFEIINYLQAQGLQRLHPLHIGGGRDFPWGRIALTIAHHGSSMPDGSYGGLAAGIVVEAAGKRLYHAGDTGLFYDMSLIGEGGLDLALLPIGDNFTMGPADALRAVRLLKPRQVIPMHYNTFEVIRQDPTSWASQTEKETGTRVSVLKPGESVVV